MHVFWLKLLRYMRFFEEFDLAFQDFKERERKKKKESLLLLKRIFDAFNTNTWWIAYQFHFLSTPLLFSAINLAVKAQQRIAKALKLELMRDTMLPSMKNLLRNTVLK